MDGPLLSVALPAHLARGFCPEYEGETVTYYINKTKRIKYRKKHRHQMKPFKPISHMQADRAAISALDSGHLESNSGLLKKRPSLLNLLPKSHRLSITSNADSDYEAGRRSRTDSMLLWDQYKCSLENNLYSVGRNNYHQRHKGVPLVTSPRVRRAMLRRSGSGDLVDDKFDLALSPRNAALQKTHARKRPKKHLTTPRRDITTKKMNEKFQVKVLNRTIKGQPGYQLYPRDKKFDMSEYRRLYHKALPDPYLPSWEAYYMYKKPEAAFTSASKEQNGVVRVSVDRTQKLDFFDLKPYKQLYRKKVFAEKQKGAMLKQSKFKSIVTNSPEFATLRKSLRKRATAPPERNQKKGPSPPKRVSTAILDELSLKSVCE